MNITYITGATSTEKTTYAKSISDNEIKLEYVNQIVEYSMKLKNEPNIEYIEFGN